MFQQVAYAGLGRSLPLAAAAVVGAAAVALAPSAAPGLAPVADPAARLAAAALPLESDLLDPGAAAGAGDVITGLYEFVEPWMKYGVDWLEWTFLWTSVYGALAPQLEISYDFGESIMQSLVSNTADALDGSVSFGDALSNVGSDTVDAFKTFFDDEVDWVNDVLLPPKPPLDTLVPGATESADAGSPDLDAPADLTPDLDGLLNLFS
jgi:hypothetical protein